MYRTSYTGKDGVELGSGLRSAVLLELPRRELLISRRKKPPGGEPHPLPSFDRRSEISKISAVPAPDSDPYVVVSGGRLSWIQDA